MKEVKLKKKHNLTFVLEMLVWIYDIFSLLKENTEKNNPNHYAVHLKLTQYCKLTILE